MEQRIGRISEFLEKPAASVETKEVAEALSAGN
jgi:hypothetical protein